MSEYLSIPYHLLTSNVVSVRIMESEEEQGGPSGYDFEPMMTEAEYEAMSHANVEEEGTGQDQTVSPNRRDNASWCICTKCDVMDSEVECICCNEIGSIADKLNQNNLCVTEHDDFQSVCLTKAVLETSWAFLQHSKGNNTARDLQNRQYRFIAYKMFTLWAHGKLGKKNRTPVPSCAVRRIRQEFPDGEYTGFLYADDVYAEVMPEL